MSRAGSTNLKSRSCSVRYEDMLADAGRELARVVQFARPELAVDRGAHRNGGRACAI